VQPIPIIEVAARDDFGTIKNASRDDILATHRVPPQLLGMIPTNAGGFGDVEKATKVFVANETRPISDVKKISRDEARLAFSSGNAEEICIALVAVTFHDPDLHWVQELCLNFLSHGDSRISGLAATCLGHLARIHRNIDREKVLSALHHHLSNEEIAGRVEDAIDDIEMFSH
jgi:hypothetical protein